MVADAVFEHQGDLAPARCAAQCEGTQLAAGESLLLFFQSDLLNVTDCVRALARPSVVVLHNSDSDGPGAANEALLDEPLVTHVFAQNCDRAESDRLTCLPIGLENRYLGPQHPPLHKGFHGSLPEQMIGFVSGLVPHLPAAGVFERRNPAATYTSWAMFDRSTHAPVRDPLWRMLVAAHETGGDPNPRLLLAGPTLPVHQLYRRMLEMAAMLCPRGNGRDTLRAWETLYLGRLVVTVHSTLDPLFERLPVLLLDRWEDALDERRIENATCEFRRSSRPAPPHPPSLTPVAKLFSILPPSPRSPLRAPPGAAGPGEALHALLALPRRRGHAARAGALHARGREVDPQRRRALAGAGLLDVELNR